MCARRTCPSSWPPTVCDTFLTSGLTVAARDGRTEAGQPPKCLPQTSVHGCSHPQSLGAGRPLHERLVARDDAGNASAGLDCAARPRCRRAASDLAGSPRVRWFSGVDLEDCQIMPIPFVGVGVLVYARRPESLVV